MNLFSAIDLLGWAAFTCTITGTGMLVQNRFFVGWCLRFLGDIMWLTWSALLGYPSAIVNEMAFLSIDAWGLWKSFKETSL